VPNINLNLPAAWAVLAGFLVFSFFTHSGWWAWTGLLIFVVRLLPDNSTGKGFGYLFLTISLGLFIFGIFSMSWNYF